MEHAIADRDPNFCIVISLAVNKDLQRIVLRSRTRPLLEVNIYRMKNNFKAC